MPIAGAATAIGAIGAGTSAASSIYSAFKGQGKPNPLFGQLQTDYVQGLRGKVPGNGLGPTSMGTLTEMSRTGMPTDVGPMFEALMQSQQRFNQQGRGNLLEQFGASGLRYSQPMMNALVDYESQLNSNYGSILANYVFQAMEAARGRQVQASAIGQQAYAAPALGFQQQLLPGTQMGLMGQNLSGFGNFLSAAYPGKPT